MKVLTPSEMRATDSLAIDGFGIPSRNLMEHAGRAVAEFVLDRLPHVDLAVVLAGRGNNGGDGLVAARWLYENGRNVEVVLVREGKELSPDCHFNVEALPKTIPIFTVDNEADLKPVLARLKEQAGRVGSSPMEGDAIFIDALLGTGVKGQVTGLIADLLREAANMDWSSVAVDIPSGINGTDGSYLGAAIPAIATITMGLPKSGLYLDAGVEYSGDVIVVDIGFPQEAIDSATPIMETIEERSVSRLFADDRGRPDEVALHKGDFGRVLVVAGSRGMIGANELCCRAALRSGCGMVVGAIPLTEYAILAARTGPEIMTAPVAADDSFGCFTPEAMGDLDKWIEWADVLALGPGFGNYEPALEFARELVKVFPNTPNHQIVIDADGLRAFEADPSPLKGRFRTPILTPHPGEFHRLTQSHELPDGKIDQLIAYAKLSDSVIVLKGARTLIANPREGQDCPLAVNVETGNPGMATAGSGDVLTGIIAGLSGQPTIAWDPFRIACTSVYLHGLAGDLAGSRYSRQAMIAGDIVDQLPRAFLKFKSNQRHSA
ncbi:MAG: NAD(P)H-hydrate dehydratase, partial [bacterium]